MAKDYIKRLAALMVARQKKVRQVLESMEAYELEYDKRLYNVVKDMPADMQERVWEANKSYFKDLIAALKLKAGNDEGS